MPGSWNTILRRTYAETLDDHCFGLAGSILATGLWLAASLGFKLYARNIADFNATYGVTGGAIMLMLWFYLSGLAILIGAEMNAECAREHAAGRTSGAPASG